MAIDTDIHNFYEHLVLESIREQELFTHLTQEQLADLCCLTLNQLPAHYIRHDVDMVYFLTDEERKAMQLKVHQALSHAYSRLLKNDERDEA